MPNTVTIWQPTEGDSIRNTSGTLLYYARGSNSESEVRFAAYGAIAAASNGAPLSDVQVDAIMVDDTDPAKSMWMIRASYSSEDKRQTPAPGQCSTKAPIYRFHVSGGTQHIEKSIEVVGRYGINGDTPPDPQLVIGGGLTRPAGCDINATVITMSIVRYWEPATVDQDYRRKMTRMAWHTNNADFGGFHIGEVLFAGCNLEQHGDAGVWEGSYDFWLSLNIAKLELGGNITGASLPGGGYAPVTKKGWEYLDIRYRRRVVGSGAFQQVTSVPFAAYTHRVYDLATMTDLWSPETL
jgi:hypothetical protein